MSRHYTYRFADILIAEKVARTEILLSDGFIVDDSEGADAGKSQVLCDFSAERAQ